MSSFGTFRVTDKKCATCNFYEGERHIELRNYEPYYVKADSGNTPCPVNHDRMVSGAYHCSSWRIWVSIA